MIEVIAQRCDGCGACVDACPTRAITIVDGLARVDTRLCRLCEACLDACPRDALVLTESPIAVGAPTSVALLPHQSPAVTVMRRPTWLTKAAPLAAAVVGFVGREVLPLVIDRLTAPTAFAGTDGSLPAHTATASSSVVRRQRHRYRGGRA